MLMIRNGKIMLTRGDSAYITVTLKSQEGSAYTMQAGDKLTPEQTEKLASGSYSYDIQLTTVAGDVFTVAGATSINSNLANFIVLPEVTV